MASIELESRQRLSIEASESWKIEQRERDQGNLGVTIRALISTGMSQSVKTSLCKHEKREIEVKKRKRMGKRHFRMVCFAIPPKINKMGF